MNIVILDGYTENPGDLSWEDFSQLGPLTVYDRTDARDIISRIGQAEAVIINKTPITEETMMACPSMKYIGVLATGYNVVDVKAASRLGITVTNIPTYGTAAVSQYVFALLLEICHHVALHNDAVKGGEWSSCPDFCFWKQPLIELAHKTMGIIGFGRIGQATARIAAAMGMNVIVYDLNIDHSLENEHIHYVSEERLFAESDIISLHCPLFPDTKEMINRDTIRKMKDGVILINTSRGPLIVEEDLAASLKSGKVYAAAVDVVSTEPIKKDNPLLDCPNCIITPHIAWAPAESRLRLMRCAVDNLKAYIVGKPQNVVHP